MITIREGLGEWLKSMLWIDNYIFLNSFLDRELHNLVLTFMVSGSVRKKNTANRRTHEHSAILDPKTF